MLYPIHETTTAALNYHFALLSEFDHPESSATQARSPNFTRQDM